MSKQRFEMVEGGASKFWEIEQIGAELHIAWGKIGTAGQSQVKRFDDETKARAQAGKLVKEKTGKGYVAAGELAPASATVAVTHTKLSYVIADFDAEDTITFDVKGDGAGYRVVCVATDEAVTADALASASGIWVVNQRARSPQVVDGKRLPPFIVSRAMRDALVGGRVTFTTGFGEDRELTVEVAPLDALDEAARAVAGWEGAMLSARNDEGVELVIANAEVPQLLYFRVDDACTIEWQEGVLPGATASAPASAKPKRSGKATPAEVLASADATKGQRMKALEALADAATDEAIGVIASQLTGEDPAVAEVANESLKMAFFARRNAGKPVDLLPLVRELLARTSEVPLPDASTKNDVHPSSAAFWTYIMLMQSDPRKEVLALLKEIAWKSLRGRGSEFARSLLVRRGDEESLELMFRVPGALPGAALARLGTRGVERAQTQLSALDAARQSQLVQDLFHELGPVKLTPADAAAWWSLLGPHAGPGSGYVESLANDFRRKHRLT